MDEQLDPKKTVEATIFMSAKALGISEIASLAGIASPGAVEKMVRELVEEYRSRDTALEILEISGKYMFSIKSPYASKVSGLASGPDLSKGALRILAYISKNDGVMQSQLVKYFGSQTYDYMKELVENEFVEAKKFKRSKKISTTPKFKEYFAA
ncbi:MAG: SMC-Scp complex subunit ScpB [Candidatus Micrarchaeota archaeon]|nr:SMC-Scp complex subunit ScpB [Candidatus Micrarchaeota archaeon]